MLRHSSFFLPDANIGNKCVKKKKEKRNLDSSVPYQEVQTETFNEFRSKLVRLTDF